LELPVPDVKVKYPADAGVQVAEPSVAEYVPLAQDVQLPFDNEYFPAGHREHTLSEVTVQADLEYEPAVQVGEQREHEGELAVVLKVDPATQSIHERRSAERDFPGAHSAQAAVAQTWLFVEGSVQIAPPFEAGVVTEKEAVCVPVEMPHSPSQVL